MYWEKEFLLLVLVVGQVVSQILDDCFANNENPNVIFGTRTAYHFVHGKMTPYDTIPNCRPVQIWMMIRHGTRYLSRRTYVKLSYLSKMRDLIIHNHKVKGYGRLCDGDLKNLAEWNLESLTKLKNGELSEQGGEEMKQLGKRIRSNFPELFPPLINDVGSWNYRFRTTSHERATSSCREFMLGLLDRVNISTIGSPATDALFSSYNQCPRWVTEVAQNQEHMKEVIKFKKGSEFQKLIFNVSRRLGFSVNIPNGTNFRGDWLPIRVNFEKSNISPEWISNIWNMCRYEKAWRIDKVSPWCAIFSNEELRIFEFKEDLVDYYTRGGSHEFNIHLGCPSMRDLFWHFERLESDNYSNEPKGIFNIGRSNNLHSFLAAMGFANDSTPLLASDFSLNRKYRWKTSEIASFAANLAAVFYKCNDTGSPNKVKFYLSEKPVFYEGCQSGLCDWEYLKNKFRKAAIDCRTDFCYSNTAIRWLAFTTLLVFLSLSMITMLVYRRWMLRRSFHFSLSVWPWRQFNHYFRIPIKNVRVLSYRSSFFFHSGGEDLI